MVLTDGEHQWGVSGVMVVLSSVVSGVTAVLSSVVSGVMVVLSSVHDGLAPILRSTHQGHQQNPNGTIMPSQTSLSLPSPSGLTHCTVHSVFSFNV